MPVQDVTVIFDGETRPTDITWYKGTSTRVSVLTLMENGDFAEASYFRIYPYWTSDDNDFILQVPTGLNVTLDNLALDYGTYAIRGVSYHAGISDEDPTIPPGIDDGDPTNTVGLSDELELDGLLVSKNYVRLKVI